MITVILEIVKISNKIIHSIKLIKINMIYILCRSDLIMNDINLNIIDKDKIYFCNNHLNPYTTNENRINDNIIITKNFNELIKLKELHDYNQINKNYLDINLYKFLNERLINFELINIDYKLVLSECNIIAISGDLVQVKQHYLKY